MNPTDGTQWGATMEERRCNRALTGVRRNADFCRIHITRILQCAGLVLALLVFLAANARAQALTGDILGTVTDSSGGVMAGATVTVTNVETGLVRSTQTSGAGDYVLNLLFPGTYSVRVEAAGFKTYETKGVRLGAGDRTRIDATMTVGQANQSVTVNVEEQPVLQTDSSAVQDVVTEQEVSELPLNGRNVASVIQQTAGVNQASANSISSGNRPDDRRPGFSFSANGQSDLANNQLVDGLDNNEREQGFSGVRPSIDAISEIRVLTSDYAAELGRTSGAVVNIITKSGSNDYHGDVYEYFRNDIFDARDFFAITKPEYRQNVFGGSFGGPIQKDRTFFFVAVEENRLIQGITQTTTVPTLFEEENPGNFSDIGGPIVASVNPVSLTYFQMYPHPTDNSTTVNNYTSEPNKTQYSTNVDARVDHRLGNADSLFVRFAYNPVSSYLPGPFPAVQVDGTTIMPSGGNLFTGPSKTTATNVQANYIHIFNPHLILELKAGYTRININTSPDDLGTNIGNKIGVINSNISPDSSGLPLMWMLTGDYASLGGGIFIPIEDANNTSQYNAAVTYTRGTHDMKLGGAVIRRQLNYLQDEWAAAGGFAFLPTPPYFNSMADFLAGDPAFSVRGDALAKQGLRSWEPDLYAQDNWRVKPWLTLNLGLRWETYTPITAAHDRFANFNVNTLTVQIAGQGTSSTGGVKTDYSDFSPRLGFAATIGHGMVVRGGFAYSYYPPFSQTQLQNLNPPFNYSCFPCFGTTFPTVPLPSSSASNPVGTVSTIAPGIQNSYVRQYNLFFEKQVGANSFQIGGVGTQGRRQFYLRNLDLPAPPGPGNPTPPFVFATQLPLVNDIQFVDNSGYANYYGLEMEFTRRMTHGLTFNANYNWGHGLSNSIQGASTFTNQFALLTNDPKYDYGNSALDVRHRIAGWLSYELPFGKTQHGLAALATKDWQVNLIGFWQTGLPFTVVDGAAAINLPGITSDRPDQIASASLSNPTINEFFNTAAFQRQVAGTPGDERSNSVYGPHARVLNVSAMKDFSITERWRLQFRAECFNLTNTPNFAAPAADISVPATFGVISSTAANMNPREFEFALKLMF